MNNQATLLMERTPGRRILALDALRGIAALVVACHHFHFAFNMGDPPWYLAPLFAGHAAVMLFFVLSGYVLSLPYWHGRLPAYPLYLLRRFFRIYVPYAAAVVLALLVGSRLLYASLPLDPWFYYTWHSPFTAGTIARQFLTMSTSSAINTAFWSLRYEMEMSIVFPAVCWLIKKLGPMPGLVLAFTLNKGAILIQGRTYNPNLSETCTAVIYGSYFLLGAIMAWKREEIAHLYHRTPRWAKVVLLCLVIGSYYNRYKPILVPLGAGGAILFAQHSRVRRVLATALPEYLGRISYSLYLVHGTVLFATLILLYTRIPLPLVFIIYGVVTFVVSHIFYRLVEEPATRLGKYLTRRKMEPEVAPR